MSVSMTLAEKVAALDFNELSRYADPPFDQALDAADARDWVLWYGIAVGLARTEEPCETIESVASGHGRRPTSRTWR